MAARAVEPRPTLTQSEERLARALTGDPLTVREARDLLLSMDKRGWTVDAVTQDRFFAITPPQLDIDGSMRPRAMTALLGVGDDGSVAVEIVEGWVVD